jgi:alpha-L-rhamnosidase
VALRAQLEARTGTGWQVAAASQPGWRTAPSHITAADLIGGQREDRRRAEAGVHDVSFDDRTWPEAASPRRRRRRRPVGRSPGAPRASDPAGRGAAGARRDAYVVDFGQNFSGWVRLERPAGGR